MKHIKNFLAINESYQDGVEILDAIENSPEGKDLCKISNVNSKQDLASAFELKRTGRIHYHRGGSKTYIEKDPNGNYYFESYSSNGGAFGRETYPTIKECLRALFTKVLSKRSMDTGIKKTEFRNWVDQNITPGQELSEDDIVNRYLVTADKKFPDLSLIEQSEFFKIAQAVFPNFKYVDAGGYTHRLQMNVWKPFETFFCKELEIYENNLVYLTIKGKVGGKSRVEPTHSRIILCDPQSVVRDFDKFFLEYINYIANGWDENQNRNQNQNCSEYPKILRLIFDTKNRAEGDLFEILKNIIENAKVNDFFLYSKIIENLEKSDKFSWIAKKYKELDSDLLKGAKALRRFGFDQ